jgi:hypothetical protein
VANVEKPLVTGNGRKDRGADMADVMTSGGLIDAGLRHQARQSGASTSASAQKLVELFALVDKSWFRDRHSVHFELDTMGSGPALLIWRAGRQLIAKWTTRGDALVFTTASGTEVRAEVLDCAVSITCEFLDQTKARRN